MPDRQMLMLWQRIHGLCGVRRKIKMDRSFIGNLNEVEIRHAKKGCMCKVCDRELNDDMIVYLRSCRLHGQLYHICIPCWRKINALVEEELDNLGDKNIGGKQ